MRTFIAIELPAAIKDTLSRLQEELKLSGADVKWVEPKNIHLTLKFLGERDEKKVEKISAAVEETAKNYRAYKLRINSLGAFPGVNSPRVIWVGLDSGDAETKEIVAELEEKIAKLGIPKEDRAFSSHITIGRARSGLNKEKLAQELKKLADYFGRMDLEFLADKIVLFKSTLTPNGPVYEPLSAPSLKAS